MDIFKKTALLGTDRSPLDESQAEALASNGIEPTGDVAYDVLNGLASLYLMEKVARKFPSVTEKQMPLLIEEETDLTPISAASFQDFELLMSGIYPQALPIFIHMMQKEKRRFEHKDLPAVLNHCSRKPYFFQCIRPVLGARTFWLMELNPEWQHLLQQKIVPPLDNSLARKEIEALDEHQRRKIDWFLEKIIARFKN